MEWLRGRKPPPQYLPPQKIVPKPGPRPKPIFLDAANVARYYGKTVQTTEQKQAEEEAPFCTAGILIAMKYFLGKGNKVVAVIQEGRANGINLKEMGKLDQFVMKKIMDPQNSESLFKIGLVLNVPLSGGKGDDEWLISQAIQHGGLILSCDGFKPQSQKYKTLKSEIEQKSVQFTFDGAGKLHLLLLDQSLDCKYTDAEFDKVKDQQMTTQQVTRALKEIDGLLEYFSAAKEDAAAGVSRTLSDGAQQPKKVRCRFYPECKNGPRCPFMHPTVLCEFVNKKKDCPYGGDRCWFYHPKCKNYNNCTKRGCQNVHRPRMKPEMEPLEVRRQRAVSLNDKKDISKVPCRFGDKCRYGAANCPYKHY